MLTFKFPSSLSPSRLYLPPFPSLPFFVTNTAGKIGYLLLFKCSSITANTELQCLERISDMLT